MKKYIFILLTLSPMVWGASYPDHEDPTHVSTGGASSESTLSTDGDSTSVRTGDPSSESTLPCWRLVLELPYNSPLGYGRYSLEALPQQVVDMGSTGKTAILSRSTRITLGKEGDHSTRLGALDVLLSVVEANKGLFRVAETDSLSSAPLTLEQDVAQAVAQPRFWSPMELNWESSEIGKAELEKISQLTHLMSLNLKNNKIGPDAVGFFGNMRALIHLRLSDNQLGDEGAIALSKLPLPKLRKLSLLNNEITDKGKKALTEAFPEVTIDFEIITY